MLGRGRDEGMEGEGEGDWGLESCAMLSVRLAEEERCRQMRVGTVFCSSMAELPAKRSFRSIRSPPVAHPTPNKPPLTSHRINTRLKRRPASNLTHGIYTIESIHTYLDHVYYIQGKKDGKTERKGEERGKKEDANYAR